MNKRLTMQFAIAIISSMIWLLCMPSCTRSDAPLSSPQEQPLKDLGKDSRAVADALDLYKAMYGSALRSNSSELEVESVIRSLPNSLRSLPTDSLGVCVVNFKDNKGFVVMNEAKGNSPIAIVEQGTFDINHLKSTKQDSAIYFLINNAVINDLKFKKRPSTYDGEIIKNRGFSIIELIEHKTKTRWDQEYPYFKNDNDCPAGCVAVAMGQAFAYYKTIKHPIRNGILVDWDAIERECSKNNGHLYPNSNQTVLDQVNKVLWWIGQSNGAKYRKDGTGISSKKALKFAQENGFETCPKMYKFTAQQVRNGLLDNKLTYMHGSGEARYFIFQSWSWTVGGHAWIVDGYAKVQSNSAPYRKYELVHVNWGWDGQLDGYFYADVFDASHEPVVPSGSLRSVNKKNFQFGVEMTHIYPKSYDQH